MPTLCTNVLKSCNNDEFVHFSQWSHGATDIGKTPGARVDIQYLYYIYKTGKFSTHRGGGFLMHLAALHGVSVFITYDATLPLADMNVCM